ncbi:MAG: hypothetical protein HC828_07310 [Blastochloris sp.]|nr:hypothetical protein [Blastochloris sp.]
MVVSQFAAGADGACRDARSFPHLLFHFVLPYSNVEVVSLCFTESFAPLAEGREFGLWQVGGVPEHHRTANLSAAVQAIEPDGRRR